MTRDASRGDRAFIPLVWTALLLAGCGGTVVVEGGGGGSCSGQIGEGCAARVDGVCVGAEAALTCEPEACACASLTSVGSSGGLPGALAGAAPGSCIELTGTSYGDVAIPEGVTLVAQGTRRPRLGSVTMASASSLCGVQVSGGLELDTNATDVSVRNVVVADPPERGIYVPDGASARIADVTVTGSADVALLMARSGDMVIERTAVLESENFGLAASCGDCGCTEAPTFSVRMRKVAAVRNAVSGIFFEGVDVQMESIAVVDSRVGSDFAFGSGLTSSCGSLVALDLEVAGSADYGIGVFDSDVTIGGEGEVRISDNLFGAWFVNVGDSASSLATLQDAQIVGNRGAGVAIGGVKSSGTVSIQDSTIRETENVAIPVLINGVSASSADVGDGLLWLDGANVDLARLRIEDSERASFLINGAAVGTIDDVTFGGGDSGDTPLMQNYFGGPEPTISGDTPELSVTSSEIYPVPISPGG